MTPQRLPQRLNASSARNATTPISYSKPPYMIIACRHLQYCIDVVLYVSASSIARLLLFNYYVVNILFTA